MKKGFTLIEVSAAVILLAVCAASLAQLAALVVSERVAERTRRTAIDQLQNVLERLAATEPEKLAAGDFDQTPFESLIERSLPDGKIVFETKPFNPDSVILTVTVSWSNVEKRPRRSAAMFRMFPLSVPSAPENP